MKRALIIRQPWVDKIFDSGKVWEMRSGSTMVRGRIGIIEAGTGLIVGEVTLLGSGQPLTEDEAKRHIGAHQVKDIELLKKWRYPWFLEDARRYKTPIPYDHPKGAVTWVRIDQ